MKLIERWTPRWISHYRREHLSDDVIAGFIVTVLVIPQSLAYAMLAGLPPQVGLYASIFPVIAYALLGSSMTQAVGPVAITAIMTFAVLSPLETPGSPQYLALAATLSLLSGVLVLTFGALRLGFLSQLLSRPVISGFISGSAVLIVLSQIKFLLGISPQGSNSWQVLTSLFENYSKTNQVTLTIGASALVLLYAARRWLAGALVRVGVSKRRAEFAVRLTPLAVLIVATSVVIGLELDVKRGVAVVGVVKEGLASFTFFMPDPQMLELLVGPALILALIGMVQNISMAQALAIRRREKVDANRELVGHARGRRAIQVCGEHGRRRAKPAGQHRVGLEHAGHRGPGHPVAGQTTPGRAGRQHCGGRHQHGGCAGLQASLGL